MKIPTFIITLFICSSIFSQQNHMWFVKQMEHQCLNQIDFHVGIDYTILPEGSQDLWFEIYWGDGSDTIVELPYSLDSMAGFHILHTYTSQNIFYPFVIGHSTITETMYYSDTLTLPIILDGNCGSVHGNSEVQTNCSDSSQIYLYNVLYDVIDTNDNIINFTDYGFGFNVNNLPLIVRINQQWLNDNNFTQISPDFIVTGFDSINGVNNGSIWFNLGVIENSLTTDFKINSTYGSGIIPLLSGSIHLNIMNIYSNCQDMDSATVKILFPNQLIPDFTNLINAQYLNNELSFQINFNSTSNFNIEIPIYVDSSSVNFTEFQIPISIYDINGNEENLSNNFDTIYFQLFNSYDPNQKTVNKGQNINPNEQEELIYTIDYQNEGNYPALNVRLLDTLSANLDFSTFRVLNQKHNVVTNLNTNTGILEFKFPNINLSPKEQDEEGSKGFVTYAIKEKANLPINSEIENTAYIYFDFNPAIITNTTYNKNSLLGISENKALDFQIFPNPAKNKLNVESKFENNDVFLLDLSGKMIFNQKIGFKGQIDVSSIENGVYYLKIVNNQTNSVQKIVVNK